MQIDNHSMKKEYKLTQFDLFCLGMTIKGAWVYSQAPDYDKMRDALALIAGTYPFLNGRYREDGKTLVWDDTCSVPLPFTRADLRKHSLADVIAEGDSVWTLVKPYSINSFKGGSAGPFSAVLAELKDGAMLFVQCAHAVMDGNSFYGLVEDWSAAARGESFRPRSFGSARLPLPGNISKEETERQVVEKGWIRISPWKMLKMVLGLALHGSSKKTFILECPQEELSRLRKSSGAGSNAVLCALAMKHLAARLKGHESYTLLLVADLRGRAEGVDEDFFGNMSQPVVVGRSIDPGCGTEELAAVIAEGAKAALEPSGVSDNVRLYLGSSHYGLPYFFFDASDMNSGNPGTLYVNNQLKFRACELDWGCGKPRYAFPNDLTDMIKFWQPVSGGPVQIIFGGAAASIAAR
ncbi:MAG: acyltransferase [Candidatus Cryptobacteroides sp.]